MTSTGSPSSSLKHCAHASPSCSTPAFQRQSLLQCFPWSSSCSLCQRCFFSITISLKVLQDSLLPAAGWAVHVTQLVPIYYSGEDGRGDEATLGFRGGRLPVLSQASQDWLLPMVVSQVLQVLQYAEKQLISQILLRSHLLSKSQYYNKQQCWLVFVLFQYSFLTFRNLIWNIVRRHLLLSVDGGTFVYCWWASIRSAKSNFPSLAAKWDSRDSQVLR